MTITKEEYYLIQLTRWAKAIRKYKRLFVAIDIRYYQQPEDQKVSIYNSREEKHHDFDTAKEALNKMTSWALKDIPEASNEK